MLALGSCRDEQRSMRFQRLNSEFGFRLYYQHYPKNTFSEDTVYTIECNNDWTIRAIRKIAPDSEDYEFFGDDTVGCHAHIVSTKKGRLNLTLYPDGAFDTVYYNGCPFKVRYSDSMHYTYDGLLSPCGARSPSVDSFLRDISWYEARCEEEHHKTTQQEPQKF